MSTRTSPIRPLAWLALAAALLLGAPGLALEPAPARFDVRGQLTATGGGPVADGQYTLVVSLYDGEQAVQPLWTETHPAADVGGGRFAVEAGAVEPINPLLLSAAQSLWIGVAVDGEPENARRPLPVVGFAHVAAAGAFNYAAANSIAGPALQALQADASNVAAVALALECSQCVTTEQLSFDDNVDASGFSVTAASFIGSGAKLSGLSLLQGDCPAGQAMVGATEGGQPQCAFNAVKGALGTVTNGSLTNEFVDKFELDAPVDIADNNPIGSSAVVTVPDIGTAKAIKVHVGLTNSDISTVSVSLFDPNNVEYLLWDKGGPGTDFAGVFPTPDATLNGDLTTWYGQNAAGNWILKVVDLGFKDNTTDGSITTFAIDIETISNKKVQVKGDLIVDGNLTVDQVALGGLVPSGAIMAFNLDACPSGWAAADGDNGTLDLQGRFPIGVGDLPQGGSIALGDGGGSHQYRIGGTGQHKNDGCCGSDYIHQIRYEWQGESSATANAGTSQVWSAYTNHLPPYAGLIYCERL